MTFKMPRGAMPAPRSELAASERYSPETDSDAPGPSGEFPSPNHELVAAKPYKAAAAPESFLAWPIKISSWGNDKMSNSLWAEEAFAKACAQPQLFIPTDVVMLTARECASANFAKFMQTIGFQMGSKACVDGPFNSVDWTNAAALNSAIANVGPVKIGVASVNLTSGPHGKVTPGTSGWGIYGLPAGQPENHCASLCGYGCLATMVDLFKHNGVSLNLPSDMPTGLCYAMFSWGSIGIIDQTSLMNITSEAWVRNPTTIVKVRN
jgi:hypothetical protein